MITNYTSAQIDQAISSHPIISDLINDDTVQSWPIPVNYNDRVMLHFFFYENLGGGDLSRNAFIGIPHFRVIADPNKIDNIHFKHAVPEDFGIVESEAYLPYAKNDGDYLGNLTPHDCIILVNALYRLTDEILLIYLKPLPSLNKCDRSIIVDYNAVFKKLTQKSLLPLYKAINPSFYEWVDSSVNIEETGILVSC